MRLTAELIHTSLSYLNPLKERELDLRGHKIPAIENLGIIPKDHEAIDFTDNDISTLGNFPLLPRLQTLLCARNRVREIQRGLGKSLPGLSTLVLDGNEARELGDLEALGGCGKLVFLSLVGNPVASKEHYRPYLLHLVPTLRYLDHTKIRDSDRQRSKLLFGTLASPTELAKSISSSSTRSSSTKELTYTSMNGGAGNKNKKLKTSEQERGRMQKLIRKAKTFREIQELEKMMAEGRVPAGGGEGEEDEEMEGT